MEARAILYTQGFKQLFQCPLASCISSTRQVSNIGHEETKFIAIIKLCKGYIIHTGLQTAVPVPTGFTPKQSEPATCTSAAVVQPLNTAQLHSPYFFLISSCLAFLSALLQQGKELNITTPLAPLILYQEQ